MINCNWVVINTGLTHCTEALQIATINNNVIPCIADGADMSIAHGMTLDVIFYLNEMGSDKFSKL